MFCQECGFNLSSRIAEAVVETKRAIHEEIQEIGDVIFKPKKKGISFKNILLLFFIIGALGLGGLVLLAWLTSDGVSNTGTTTESQPTTFPISYLNIENYEIIFDDVGETYFTGTLKNTYSKVARNVKVRLDFYRDEALKQHFDTRNVTIINGAEANGAFSFKVPLTFYPQDLFWWLWKIEGADYGM